MNKLILFVFVFNFSAGCSVHNKNTSFESDPNPAAMAIKKNNKGWNDRHLAILESLDTNPELILIGNSIFHTLVKEDRKEVHTKFLDQYHMVNMGISGDRTENVIWRLQNGSLENIDPKVAIILIGTNNTDGNHYLNISTADQLAGGIWRICEIVGEKLPNTKVILMGILPYGYTPNHRNDVNMATNRLISKFPQKNTTITYRDIGSIYKDDKGKVNNELMPDYLHPNAKGHQFMFQALEADIKRLMK